MRHSFRRSGILAIGALSIALTLGACSDDGNTVAGAGKGKEAAGPAGAPSRADALKYSTCMRENGVANFPDPNAQGQIWLGNAGGATAIDPSSAVFKKAQDACKSLAPTGAGSGGQGQDRTQSLKYSKCMRENGVSKFPDPKPDGGIMTDNNVVDPNSPAYKAAEKACAKYQPGGPNAPRGQFTMGPGQ